MPRRSDCPISNVLDHVGDKWSLLILRDMMFFEKSTYSALQASDEQVASNILSNRLEHLERDGLVTKAVDPADKRRKVYRLTKAGLDMMPILLEMIAWSSRYDPNTNAPTDLVEQYQQDRQALIENLKTRYEQASA